MKNIIVLETPEEIAEAFNPNRYKDDEKKLYVGAKAFLVDNKGRLELSDGPANVEIGDVKTKDLITYALKQLHIDVGIDP